jgi:hypothetical protein
MVDGDGLHLLKKNFEAREGTETTDKVCLPLLQIKSWGHMDKVVGISMRYSSITVV